jgi:preprotein translocase subunit SecB
MPIADYMASGGGPTLFPFLRECVANLTGRGRFGPLWLRPINFVQLAEQLTAQQHE